MSERPSSAVEGLAPLPFPTAVVPRMTPEKLLEHVIKMGPQAEKATSAAPVQGPVAIGPFPPDEIPQTGGSHYKDLGLYEPWKILKAVLTDEEYRGYQKGTAMVYLLRERAKGGNQDIRKSADTLNELVRHLPE